MDEIYQFHPLNSIHSIPSSCLSDLSCRPHRLVCSSISPHELHPQESREQLEISKDLLEKARGELDLSRSHLEEEEHQREQQSAALEAYEQHQRLQGEADS